LRLMPKLPKDPEAVLGFLLSHGFGAMGLPNINITVDRRLPFSVWESGTKNLRRQNQTVQN